MSAALSQQKSDIQGARFDTFTICTFSYGNGKGSYWKAAATRTRFHGPSRFNWIATMPMGCSLVAAILSFPRAHPGE